MDTQKYLIPLDFTDVTINALHYGLSMAKDNGDSLMLLHIVSSDSDMKDAESKMNSIIEGLGIDDKNIVESKVVKGDVFDDMGKIAEELETSLILMATHGEKGLQKLFGSHALKIVKNSSLPVIVIQKDTPYKPIRKIGMTIDIEKESVPVVKTASLLGEKHNAEVVLVGGKHSDPNLRAKVIAHVRTSMDYLKDHQIESSVVLLDRDNFEENLIDYCKNEGVDMLAATFYPDTFHAFSQKFVQHLFENSIHIPVITIDSEAAGIKGMYSF
jgi:nucleotide-binding universal stress UspA family protein